MNRIERPRSIHTNISTQRVGQELLVYDESRHQAFCLNATSAAVFTRANGVNTLRQIASGATLELALPITEELVAVAVEQLRADGLMEPASMTLPRAALSRRQMVQRLGVGAAMMVPVVAAVMAPKAAQAYSGCFDCNVAKPTVNKDLSTPTSSPSSTGSGPTIFQP